MLMNNLDPEVAEHPDELVVYGGTGRAARSWEAFDAIVRTLQSLEDDETMLVQSGKPVGVFRTNVWAPRVLLANSNLVGDWANWEEFRKLEAEGLMMYGQMTAGSWIYIGTQGILQGTFETFGAVARKRFGGTLAGTITLTARRGRHGRCSAARGHHERRRGHLRRCDESRIDRRIAHRYLDTKADELDDALQMAIDARDAKRPLSIGVGRQRRRGLSRAARAGSTDRHRHRPDLGARSAVVPAAGHRVRRHEEDGGEGSRLFHRAGAVVDGQASQGHGRVHGSSGAEVFDYGNSIRDEARKAGYDRAFDFPGFRSRLHPSAVRGGPRAVPLGGAVRRSRKTSPPPTRRSWNCFPTTHTCVAGSRWQARRSRSKDSRRASAGSATANATAPV